jgi:serine/threonine protein kinase
MSDYVSKPIRSSQGSEIGRGGSSQVKLVRDPDTGRLTAVKFFSGPNLDRRNFIQEVQSLATLNHPCILRIINWAPPSDDRCCEIHPDYAERGSLATGLKRRRARTDNGFWTTTKSGIAICDMVLGMKYVHSRGIIHRDMKPSNIFVRDDGRALIGDFGSSRFQDDDGTLTGVCGTVHYAAPELFDADAELTPKVDVWGFGLTLYEIVSGFAVFPISLSPFDVIRKMRRGYRPVIPVECGGYMEGLIRRCWSDDPSSRPSFSEILAEFRDRQFAILPGIACEEIRRAVDDVLRWEYDARVWRS